MPRLSARALAALAMSLAVVIYGGQFVSVRWGLQSGLSVYDMAALRFISAGAVMLPFFLRAGIAGCAGLGWGRGLALAVTGGAPMTLLSNVGLQWAPAAHGAAIQPGMVAVAATLLAAYSFGLGLARGTVLGLAVVLCGLAAIAVAGSSGEEGRLTALGDLIFVVCGLCWGVFTWMCGRWQVPSVTGTAVVSVLSAAAFLPVYVLALEPGLAAAPWSHLAFHSVNQGLLNVVLALVLWTYGTRILGVTVAARFPPMIPVVGTLIGIPALGEVPGPLAAAGVCAIVAGLLLAAGAGARRRR